ncbi:MAG: 2-C-methyl-D-erythritol 4-phosphate cytidylyltransferase [Simkaniaceae bacterium]|nr:2-C-methyl-D-erythritol 4-phosphate cytidylyltransferase [Simkaniaceae bacterium]MCF7852414.1 2-C-methyl-D-erythritol 4-phosphate cytidylyltransferase [Simkaniaceae bacterium]
MTALILLMGGDGKRLSAQHPKQFLRIDGEPIYLITLKKCLAAHPFQQIILSTHPEWIKSVQKEIREWPHVMVIKGGASRQASSYLALQQCASSIEFVMIHDAVRPFITPEIIQKNLDAVKRYGAVDTCIPATDTLIQSREGDTIEAMPSRSSLYQGQTPQTFRLDLILKAHEWALSKELVDQTDDCRLVHAMGKPIHIVLGSPQNFKITTTFDYEMASLYHRIHQAECKPTLSLKNKRFAIPGGHGGIGQAICAAIKASEGIAIPLPRADLKDPETIKKTFQQLGALDGLINCMGSLIVSPLHQLTGPMVDQMAYDNYLSLMHCCRVADIQQGGHILNIGSSSWSKGRKDFIVYSSCKAALVNFTQGLAEERPELYVNILSPSRTNTPLRQKYYPNEDPNTRLKPSDVAKRVIDILSSQVTAQHFILPHHIEL